MPDDRIVDLATLAGEDAGYWLVAIRADQSGPKIGPHWQKLIERLSTAALIALAVAPALMLIGPASSIMSNGAQRKRRSCAAYAPTPAAMLCT